MAALNKRWVGGVSAVYTLATNWAPIDLTKPAYRWVVSAAQANEYRLELIGGGDPGISAPGFIYQNSALSTEGTVGSLAVGQWDYADNDTLGYSTVYVRTAGTVDPDTLAIGYIQMYQIPKATDHVRIPAGSGAITGEDQSTVAIGDFIVEEGYIQTIGTATLPLSVDPDRFEFSGTGIAYLHLHSAAISPDVRNAAFGANGTAGLYLTGSALVTLTVFNGTVGLAWLHGQTATCATVRVNGANAVALVGKGCTITTSYLHKGSLFQHCAGTTANVFGGAFTTEEQGAVATINADGAATLTLNSTGTVTALNMQPGFTGTVDLLKSAEARTFTTITQKAGTLRVDKSVVTVTTHVTSDSKPQSITVKAA